MPDLVAITKAAIDLFNDAKNTHTYKGLQKYLCDPVVIYRVDDALPIEGSPDDIVQMLNTGQVKKWPQLICNNFQRSPESDVVVQGTGDYCDDSTAPTVKISVRCSYHFVGSQIDHAFVVPIRR